VLYIINKATKFEVARLIQKSAGLIMIKVIFNAFKLTWINTYFSPSDFVIYNHKTNFNFKKFWISLKFVKNTLKLIVIKTYYSINKVKRYY